MAEMFGTSLSYISLSVSHLEASVTFYTRFLDLQLSERFGRTALLVASDSPQHYQLALSEGVPCPGVTLGFAVSSLSDWQEIERYLLAEGQSGIREDRGWAWVLGLTDPDGYRVELFLDRRQAGGKPYWRGYSGPVEG
jgi:catechol 2,3-dioxygenase-like lactoylglutathione lyase family enzyme